MRENADGKGDFEATLTTLGWGVRRSIPHPVNFWPKLSKGPIAKFIGVSYFIGYKNFPQIFPPNSRIQKTSNRVSILAVVIGDHWFVQKNQSLSVLHLKTPCRDKVLNKREMIEPISTV